MKKPFSQTDEQSLKCWFKGLVEKDYSPSTIVLYCEALRHLYKHSLTKCALTGNEVESKARELFRCIPIHDLRRDVKKNINARDKLIAPEEFEALMRVATHPRIKALVTVL